MFQGDQWSQNCGTPNEKVLESLDQRLKPVLNEGEPYIKVTEDFLNKIKNIILY